VCDLFLLLQVCPLADFRRAVAPYRVLDFEIECRPLPPPGPVTPREDHHRPVGLEEGAVEDLPVPAVKTTAADHHRPVGLEEGAVEDLPVPAARATPAYNK